MLFDAQPTDGHKEFASRLKDQRWRLNNLYFIIDKYGNKVRFRMNKHQERLFDNLWYLNIILKARQLGFSTFVQIFILDTCLFHSNLSAGVIADKKDNAEDIFVNKIKFAYTSLPPELLRRVKAEQDSARSLTFSNGSRIAVGVSLRSGTYQLLHISEYGKICAQRPDRAEEIKTGALNTLAPGTICFIESTAEGKLGDFYEKCIESQAKKKMNVPLTRMDYRFHFFPWWEDSTYRLDPAHVRIPHDAERYFAELEDKHGITLDAWQKAWWVKKKEEQKRHMGREFPSHPDEAFDAAIEGAYLSDEIAAAYETGRVVPRLPFDARIPVNTAWDLGVGDYTTIWLHQRAGAFHNILGFIQASGKGFSWYFNELEKIRAMNNFVWGKHHAPHDIGHRVQGKEAVAKTKWEMCKELGYVMSPVPRTADKTSNNPGSDVNCVRGFLSSCQFAYDQLWCEVPGEDRKVNGMEHLRNWRAKKNSVTGANEGPVHDEASHGADGFITLSRGEGVVIKSGFGRPLSIPNRATA